MRQAVRLSSAQTEISKRRKVSPLSSTRLLVPVFGATNLEAMATITYPDGTSETEHFRDRWQRHFTGVHERRLQVSPFDTASADADGER